MSMHDVDLARLLTPIGGSAHGCGEDLAFSEAFDHIQKARIEDDTSLEQGAWVTQHRQADWRLVRSQCEQLLATQSKDLRLGFWWAEAMTKMHGFTGLSVGLSLLTQLIDQFWLGIYPEAEDEDQDARITLLNWFVKHTDGLIRQIKLTDSDKGCF
ncbi:MAG: type VI secretion system protein TssA, partial [Pseudomonadota bacterium]|nr:type VI secretion system protein TssA [Pseudomonadota bacterium]